MPLSIPLWLPLAAGLLAAVLPRALAGRVLLIASVAVLGAVIGYVLDFEGGGAGLRQVTDETWIAELGIHYKLGLDGLNLFLLLLTALIFAASILAANLREWERPRTFYFHLGLAETAVLGAFMAQDLALFVVFFDLMLVPFLFLIGTWGQGERRVAATIKLFIYTLVGSLLMLAAAVGLGVAATPADGEISFAFSDLAERTPFGEDTQDLLFLGFAAAFLVKMPVWPLHGWMPDGYRAMPMPVLAVFSAVLSKVAAYGFLKIVLPLLPDASVAFQDVMLVIALVAILYGSAMAFTTTHARLVVGYSSVAQLGFIVLGIFTLRDAGAEGALLQMVNHGLVTAPLLLIIGLLAVRAGGSEDLRDMGGLAFRAPVLATLFLIVALATLAMPGSGNFVGEFLILLGAFQHSQLVAFIASAGVVLAAVYALRAFIRAMHNRVGERVRSEEISTADGLVLVPLVLAILALALYPQLPLERAERGVLAAVGPAQEALVAEDGEITNGPARAAEAEGGEGEGGPEGDEGRGAGPEGLPPEAPPEVPVTPREPEPEPAPEPEPEPAPEPAPEPEPEPEAEGDGEVVITP